MLHFGAGARETCCSSRPVARLVDLRSANRRPTQHYHFSDTFAASKMELSTLQFCAKRNSSHYSVARFSLVTQQPNTQNIPKPVSVFANNKEEPSHTTETHREARNICTAKTPSSLKPFRVCPIFRFALQTGCKVSCKHFFCQCRCSHVCYLAFLPT